MLDGRAKVVGPNTVDVNGVEYWAERILLATGSWPTKPDFSGSELAITSNEIFDLEPALVLLQYKIFFSL